MLNVEGDAFGAGLLQFYENRKAKEEGAELSEIRAEGDSLAAAPEHSPLIERRGGSVAKGTKAAESAM